MIHQLESSEFAKVRPLFAAMDCHLAAHAVLAGAVPGTVYVDDPRRPRSALVRAGGRFHLAGDPHDDAFSAGLGRLFDETIYPQGLAEGNDDSFGLFYAPDDWERQIDVILRDKSPLKDPRHYYVFRELRNDWRAMLPTGFAVRPIGQELLEEKHLKNMDRLVEEVHSEAPSVEHFLRHCFGFCMVREDEELVAWCLSEYNLGDRCEVGIETVQEYQRRGFGTIVASALVEEALRRGITHVGWHCWAFNEASIATALKVGFEKEKEYAYYFACFDEATNLAAHGQYHFRRGEHREALAWFERALRTERAPVWATYVAAYAATALGDQEMAFGYLRQIVEKGIADRKRLETTVYLRDLRETEAWKAFIAGVV